MPPSLKQAQASMPLDISFLEQPPGKPGDGPIQQKNANIVLQIAGAALTSRVISLIFPVPIELLFLIAVGAIVYRLWRHAKSYAECKQAHRLSFVRYNQELLEYQHKKRAHVAQWRREQVQSTLNCTRPHDGENSSAPEGKSERTFRGHLERYFPAKTHANLTHKIADYPHPYTSDIAYIDRSINLYIDIEVDEPYIYNTHTATHYKASEKDRIRNHFFTEKGWLVIRFSEQQVVCHPDSCCKTVAQTIYQVAGNRSILSPFTNIPDLRPHRQWTKQEAIQMAKRKARNRYLNVARVPQSDGLVG